MDRILPDKGFLFLILKSKSYFCSMSPIQQRYRKQSPRILIIYLIFLLILLAIVILWNTILDFFATFSISAE